MRLLDDLPRTSWAHVCGIRFTLLRTGISPAWRAFHFDIDVIDFSSGQRLSHTLIAFSRGLNGVDHFGSEVYNMTILGPHFDYVVSPSRSWR